MTTDLDALVLAHLDLAERVAERCRRKWQPLACPEDWQAEAYLGLVRAAHSYDPARGEPGPYFAAKVAFHRADHLRARQPHGRSGWVRVRAGEDPAVATTPLDPARLADPRPSPAAARLDAELLLDLVEEMTRP